MTLSKRMTSILIAAAIIIITAIISVSLWFTRPQLKLTEAKEQTLPVNAHTISIKQYSPAFPMFAEVKARTFPTLKSQLVARVKAINVKNGQRVKQGQVLITLMDPKLKETRHELEAQIDNSQAGIKQTQKLLNIQEKLIEQQQAQLAFTLKTTARIQKLHKQSAASHQALEQQHQAQLQAQSQVDQLLAERVKLEQTLSQAHQTLKGTQAQLNKLRIDQSRLTIVAPFDGKLTDVSISLADQVHVGTPLLSLYDPASLELVGPLPIKAEATLLINLTQGHTVAATFKHQDQHYTTHLQRIGNQLAHGYSTALGYFPLTDLQAQHLNIGQALTLSLHLPKRPAIAILNSALFDGGTVYTIVKHRLVANTVKVMGQWVSKDGGTWRLISPNALKVGSQILTTHLPQARQGLKVTVNATT